MKQFLFLMLSLFGLSLFSQNINHPTVDKVQTTYKIASQSSATISNPGTGPDIRVQPDIAITLKAGAAADKVYLKMTDAQNNVLYQMNYQVNAQNLTDAQGNKLFYRDGNTIHIGNPNILSLKLYRYEIYTEDSQGNASSIYVITQ